MASRVVDEELQERRFIIEEHDPSGYAKWESSHVTTGFLDTDEAKSVRVQMIKHDDGTEDIYLTVTRGRGVRRPKKSRDLPAPAAKLLLDTCAPRITHARRYRKDNWRVSVFERSLFGCKVVEVKGVGLDTPIEKPPWIQRWREVTGRLTSYTLAEFAAIRSRNWDNEEYRQPWPFENVPRIVLTGGPCSGKTTVIEFLKRHFAKEAGFVPEMATLVMEHLGIRPPADGNAVANLEFQTTIAKAQRVFEDGAARFAHRNGRIVLICDRGEVDGGAYMEGGNQTLEIVSGLDISHLYERYAKVIYLSVPPEAIYNANKANNPTRKEDYQQASALGNATLKVWEGHQDVIIIGNYDSMEEKLAAVAGHIRASLDILKAA
jgi:CYTH domain-containing protein/predicted ATPase